MFGTVLNSDCDNSVLNKGVNAFVQYACSLPDRGKDGEKNFVLCVASFGMMVLIIGLVAFKQKAKITDYETKHFIGRMEDYVMEVRITDKQIEYFEKEIFNQNDSSSYGDQIQDTIESWIIQNLENHVR